MKIKLASQNAVVPTYGSECAAGMDLYSSDTYSIAPGETVLVHTGISMEIPDGYFGAIYPRSGLATKQGLRLANCVGVVDSDYRGEIMVALHNDSATTQTVELHDRIAQMVIQPYVKPQMFEAVNELSETERGLGGFGHTGR